LNLNGLYASLYAPWDKVAYRVAYRGSQESIQIRMLIIGQIGDRQEALLAALHRVPFFTTDQIARTFWSETEKGGAAARKELQRLARAGFIGRKQILAHPELTLSRPLYTWVPGEPCPHFGKLSYQCQVRWTQEPRIISVWSATAMTRNLFGSPSHETRLGAHEMTHAIHVASLYCHLLKEKPEMAHDWIPEDRLPRRKGERMPDAVLYRRNGQAYLAIEFGGSYKASRIQSLHLTCSRQGLAYELW
jgi:hypothetical protein